jgi:hypothetical protein
VIVQLRNSVARIRKPSKLNLEVMDEYLKGQPNLGLWYPEESPFRLEAYSDSDYAGANLDMRSTT